MRMKIQTKEKKKTKYNLKLLLEDFSVVWSELLRQEDFWYLNDCSCSASKAKQYNYC